MYRFCEATDRVGQRLAFERKDALLERFGSIVRVHLAGPLENDGAMIVLIVDPMHRAARDFGPRFDGSGMHPQSVHTLPTEGWDQGWMDIHHTMLEIGRNEEVFEISSHDHQRCTRSADGIKDFLRVDLWVVEITAPDDLGWHVSFPCKFEASGILARTDDESEFDRQGTVALLFDEIPERGAASGNQNGDGELAHLRFILLAWLTLPTKKKALPRNRNNALLRSIGCDYFFDLPTSSLSLS
jgi:hypothetical protein